MAKKKKNKVVEEVKEVVVVEPVAELIEEQPIKEQEEQVAEEVVKEVCEECSLGHSHEDVEPLDKHFMVLAEKLGYIPAVGDVINYKGHKCEVVRVIKNMVFCLTLD